MSIQPRYGMARGQVSVSTEPTPLVEEGLHSWIATGSCQSASGAFCAWHDPGANSLAYEYPEITGYALTFLAGHAPLQGPTSEVARKAADWLARRLDKDNFAARDDWDGNAAYNFDLAMITTGLFRIADVTGWQRYQKRAFRVSNFLRQQFDFEGRLPAISQETPGFSVRPGVWSTEGAAHLVKLTQCMLLTEEAGLGRGAGIAASIVEHSKRI